jgi:hypothetical protein
MLTNPSFFDNVLPARPVGFPKSTELFGGIVNIHDFWQGTSFILTGQLRIRHVIIGRIILS